MRDGSYVYYTIQTRITHKSPWLKPKGKLKRDESEWFWASFDAFGRAFDPWDGDKPKFRKASDEKHDVWSKTDHHGWWSVKYAMQALKRAREEDAKGTFDSRDGYRNHQQRVVHEFRIIKVTVSQKTEILTVDDIVEAA